MRLVAVVVSWNGRDDTLDALESLRGIETVVVDNGSVDGSADAIAERFPEVELIRAGVNLGFAGGNNAGIRRALDRGADWVLLVNNDATVEPGIVEALAAAAASRPDAGVLACKVLFADSDRLWYAGAGFNPYLGRSRHERFGKPDEPGTLRDTVRATGAGMAVSRAAIDAGRPAGRGVLPLRRGPRVVPADPGCRLRGRLRPGGAGATPGHGGERGCGLADRQLLRGSQRACGRRALPAAAAWLDRRATRTRRGPSRRARGAAPSLRLCRVARLAGLPERADGPALTATRACGRRPRAVAPSPPT